MRKILAAAAIMAMTLPTVAFTDAAAAPDFSPAGEEVQTISGTIAAPTRFPLEYQNGYPGLARNLFNCSNSTNNSIAVIAKVDPASWGGPFVLDNVSAAATTVNPETGEVDDVDVDVYLYSDNFGDCQPQGASPETLAEYDTDAPGEVGFIPARTKYAVIYTPTGFNTSFTMRLYAPPVIDLAGDALDLTVASGATVVWENTTNSYLQVRATDGSFDSSPGAATGIRSGETFSQSFESFFGELNVEYVVTDDEGNVLGTGTIKVGGGPGGGAPA